MVSLYSMRFRSADARTLLTLRARGVTIRSVRPVRPSLEDLFIEAVTDPDTGKARDIGADQSKRKGAN